MSTSCYSGYNYMELHCLLRLDNLLLYYYIHHMVNIKMLYEKVNGDLIRVLFINRTVAQVYKR